MTEPLHVEAGQAPAPTLRTARKTAKPRRWQRQLAVAAAGTDACAWIAGALIVTALRWPALRSGVGGTQATVLHGLPYPLVALLVGPLWVGLTALGKGYGPFTLAGTPAEWRSLGNSLLRLLVVLACVSYLTRASLSRGFVAGTLLAGGGLLLIGRVLLRRRVVSLRRRGRLQRRVVLVGTRGEVQALSRQLLREPEAGLQIVGFAVPDGSGEIEVPLPVTEMGLLGGWASRVAELEADTVAVAGTSRLPRSELRRLAWELEGVGVDLLIVPELGEMATARVSVHAAGSMTLLHLREPRFTGGVLVLKAAVDRIAATLLLVLSLPLLAVAALAIRLDNRGPIFYHQQRVGRDGASFKLYKLRTMVVGADRILPLAGRAALRDHVLFKLVADPRVTRVGRVLRRWSIDELPQLINVIRGEMSLVGPRPGLPSEVACYGQDARRRLLVRPGMTGLWQVSGRSDLTWEETVRHDLNYVENWSLTGDLAILAKTVGAVLRRRGAY